MRVRRHRKEQLIKADKRAAIAAKGTTPRAEKKVAEKPAAKAKPAKPAAPKKTVAKAEVAEKPKKAPAKKKEEAVADSIPASESRIEVMDETPIAVETAPEPVSEDAPADPVIEPETA